MVISRRFQSCMVFCAFRALFFLAFHTPAQRCFCYITSLAGVTNCRCAHCKFYNYKIKDYICYSFHNIFSNTNFENRKIIANAKYDVCFWKFILHCEKGLIRTCRRSPEMLSEILSLERK
jgi:hypothetical protein